MEFLISLLLPWRKLPIISQQFSLRIYLKRLPEDLDPDFLPRDNHIFHVAPLLKWKKGGSRILTGCPLPTPFGLGLGPG